MVMSAVLSVLFWATLALVAYTYAGYPAMIGFLAWARPRPWRRAPYAAGVSIILPVYNAPLLATRQIRRLLAMDYPGEAELIVVCDGSQDGTYAAVCALAGELRDPRMRIFTYPERRGKAGALNLALRQARLEIALFVDVRPEPEPRSIPRLLESFADPSVGCVAGELLLRRHEQGPCTSAIGGLYWRYEQWLRRLEARVDSPSGVYGGFYAARRSLVRALPEGCVTDDLFQPLAIVRQGYRCVFDERARVWDAWPKAMRGEFVRKVRTLAGNFQLLELAPWVLTRNNRIRFQFISHKLLRLVVPYLLAALLLLSALLAAEPVYRAMLWAQLGAYALAAVGLLWDRNPLRRITGPFAAFTLLNSAAVAGLYQFLRCRVQLWRIWAPQAAVDTAPLPPPASPELAADGEGRTRQAA